MSLDDPKSVTRAVLVGIILPGVSDAEASSSLDELQQLAKTLGLTAVGRVTQHRQSTKEANVLGAGKLMELAKLTGGSGVVPSGAAGARKGNKLDPADENEANEDEAEVEADDPQQDEGEPSSAPKELAKVVLFDHDLSPSQLRNLEKATSVEVLDRSSIILNIFQRHARTREARLQVEIARLKYLTPRLRAIGGGGERQRGGIGGKGAGESALELDKRLVRDRIAELNKELVLVQEEAQRRSARRKKQDTVALVGYTNAGKSSLMRQLTGSDVLVQDRLFATLDTTIRVLKPETKPRILVSDTVGFIKKLPHDLVASFRSTLDEAREAALLLHIIDASDVAWRSQFKVTSDVLEELGAADSPSVMIFNKADRLSSEQIATLKEEFPQALIMSALNATDITMLHDHIVAFFEKDMVEVDLFVPYSAQAYVNRIHESCRVLSENYDEHGTTLRVRSTQEVVDELKSGMKGRRSET